MTTSYKLRLQCLRQFMNESKIDLLLIRSTDAFLNEYVPKEESQRVYITGFSGSIGDALISQTRAILFVDGRYTLQAKTECPDMEINVATLGQSIEASWLQILKQIQTNKQQTFAIDSDRISIALFLQIQKIVSLDKIKLLTQKNSLVDKTRQKLGPPIVEAETKIWSIAPRLSGQTSKKRLMQANYFFKEHNLEAIALVLLDEIAWLTNLRGNQFPYQTTFAAKALAFPHEVWLCVDDKMIKKVKIEPGIKLIALSKWNITLKQHFANKSLSIALDPNNTTEAVAQELKEAGAILKLISSPFGPLKALKTPAEIKHLRESFARADHVVNKTQKWINKNIAKKVTLSEADVDVKVRKEFIKSGAVGLSFKPICAFAQNGAVIHYGTPNQDIKLSKGQLFLLDTGGTYEGGYATDLTRTFLIGSKKTKAKTWQKKLFTCVLKAAIAGMNARFPQGTTGAQLDAIVRNPIWNMGLNFNHGTGHGVGINVHESPPSIRPNNTTPLAPGHIFSIEPGLYIEGVGGVRIENLCTVIKDPHNPDFLAVLPLTFAPLDVRLLEKSMLTLVEKTFLNYYRHCFTLKGNQMPELPPHQNIIDFLPKK